MKLDGDKILAKKIIYECLGITFPPGRLWALGQCTERKKEKILIITLTLLYSLFKSEKEFFLIILNAL